jgi:hypothetical protein
VFLGAVQMLAAVAVFDRRSRWQHQANRFGDLRFRVLVPVIYRWFRAAGSKPPSFLTEIGARLVSEL